MTAHIDPKTLSDEEGIVWIEDCSKLRYVRESVLPIPSRRAPPSWKRRGFHKAGRMVGYVFLKPDVESENGMFYRRLFWLKPYDAPNDGPYKDGGRPAEGADPRSIVAGQTSR